MTPQHVRAWELREGDELPDERRVIQVQRDAVSRIVYVLTDEPSQATLPEDTIVPVLRRLP
jgi:hypothetical protein